MPEPMVQPALRSILLADSTVTGIVGNRVDWGWRPQGKPLPAITLTTVYDGRPKNMGGNETTRSTRVQLDSWGATYADARNGANAAIDAMTAQDKLGVRFLGFFIEGDRDLSEQTNNEVTYRVSVDFRAVHTIP